MQKKNTVPSDASKNFFNKLAPRFVLCVVQKKLSMLVYVLKTVGGAYAGKPYYDSNPDLSDI